MYSEVEEFSRLTRWKRVKRFRVLPHTCTCQICWPPYILFQRAGNYLVALFSKILSGGLTFITFNMADNDVATKAPESDAKEPSMISSEDTTAQKGASMGVRDVNTPS